VDAPSLSAICDRGGAEFQNSKIKFPALSRQERETRAGHPHLFLLNFTKEPIRIPTHISRLPDILVPALQRLLHKRHELVGDGAIDDAMVVT
jgi:hypothetical protein